MAPGAFTLWVVSSLLLSLRIAPVFALAPPFSLTAVPPMFRALFGLGVAGLMTALRPVAWAGLELSAGALAVAGLRELFLGTVFVVAFQVMFGALYVAGRTVDIQAGYGLATLIDPTSQNATPMVGTLFAYAAAVVFFAIGGAGDLLRLLSASLDLVPVGGAAPPPSLLQLTTFVSTVFVLAFGLAGGAILALFLTDAAIALMSRTLPQMNVLMLGFQVKTLLLLMVLPLGFGLWAGLLARLARYTLDSVPRLM